MYIIHVFKCISYQLKQGSLIFLQLFIDFIYLIYVFTKVLFNFGIIQMKLKLKIIEFYIRKNFKNQIKNL